MNVFDYAQTDSEKKLCLSVFVAKAKQKAQKNPVYSAGFLLSVKKIIFLILR